MKTILVTGASGGIGTAIVELLTKNNYSVITVTKAEADLTSVEAIKNLRAHIAKKIDWIVCAHGFIDTETILEQQTPEHIRTTFEVNTLSLFFLAQSFLGEIRDGGGMITLSSSAGLQANGRFSAYSASKAAANSFMQAMARNRPEKKFFAVCPGPTNTAMRERIAGDASKMQSPRVLADLILELIQGEGEYKSGDLILIKDGSVSIAGRI